MQDELKTDNKTPLVSVLMTSYNQSKYIIEAIEGVLMQKASFGYELLIGEDCSSDNSLEICREYENKYPSIIKVVFDGKNHGMVGNEQRLMDAAKGKYIAFCEADDYWIDELKLQKQLDILEKHPEYAACACQSKVINDFNKTEYRLLSKYKEDRVFYTSDLLAVGCEFQTASFMFRKSNLIDAPPLPLDINGWDRAVFIANSFKGGIYYIAEPLAVYRKNDDGISTWVTVDRMKKDLNMIKWFKSFNKKFPSHLYLSHLHYTIFHYAHNVPTKLVIKHYLLHLYYALLSFPQSKYKLKEAQRAFKIVMKPRITQTKLYRLFKK